MPYFEPILTKHISTAQIKAWILSAVDIDVDIQPFSCHNQAVERVIKIVTESSSKVYGHDECDGYIRFFCTETPLIDASLRHEVRIPKHFNRVLIDIY